MTDVKTNFKPAFEKGHKTEIEIWEILKKLDKDARIMAGKFKEYDIELPNLNKTIEVKRDLLAHKTGNYAIEYYCFGKPSGISTTKADYWMIANGDILLIQTYKLKDFIKANKEYLKRVRGGDNNESQIILIPVEYLKDIGIVLDSSGIELELFINIFLT